jgi:hypothetical protein
MPSTCAHGQFRLYPLTLIFGEKVALVQAFTKVLRFLPNSVIPPMFHNYSLIYRLNYTAKLS